MSSAATEATAPFDPQAFRHVVGHLMSGVSVLTTTSNGQRFGMTASSVTSLSMDPPMMLICINKSAPTSAAVSAAGCFAINVLGRDGTDLARQFASPSDDKFRGVGLRYGVTDAPLLTDALARIECRVVEEVTGGTHTVFLGHVLAADAGSGEPLAYFRGSFGRFEFALNDQAYARVRALVMERQFAADSVLDPEQVAVTVGADETAVFYALTRLSSDGLVRRDPERGYVVIPFDTRTCEEVFDARTAVELGAITLGIDSVVPETIEQLRSHIDVMHSCMNGEEFADFEGYLDANYALHRGIVDLAGSPTLTALFATLAIKSVMMRSFGSTSRTSRAFIDAQSTLVDAIGGRDPISAAAAARHYGEMAKQRMRDIVSEHGGVL